jgi:ATPase family associated with various cellular activities (AAA)
MKSMDIDRWLEENHRMLMAGLASVRRALQRYSGGVEEQHGLAESEPNPAAADLPPPALDTLCALMGLSAFERGVLLMCAGMELEPRFAALCAQASGNPQCRFPTFNLALSALEGAHWSAIGPSAPLRYWQLIEIAAGSQLTSSVLRIDERILHYLMGVPCSDQRLQGLASLQRAPDEPVESQRTLLETLASQWAQDTAAVVQLARGSAGSKRELAAHVCARVGRRLFVIDAADVPERGHERDSLARLLQREAVLGHVAWFFDCDAVQSTRAVIALIESLRGCCTFIGRDEPVRLSQRRVLHFAVTRPTAAEQVRLWHSVLGGRLNGQAEALAAQFDLDATDIRTAGLQVSTDPGVEGSELARRVRDVCRRRASGSLDVYAPRIQPRAQWSDLILAPQQLQTLREIAAHVRHRTRVHDTWGFSRKSAHGLGISALFAGASGTGKTMAAEVLAQELHLDLYCIDLSQVVSKYIGETEKNLQRVFAAAEECGAVLLFDEADALFGKRSEVKDSHDRYANIEVSYLLQRMEAYRGLAILTTNMRTFLDSAFLRRLRFIVQFGPPDSAQRAQIWRRVLPAELPVAQLDFAKLARLNVTGGSIRSIAMHAAFLAADDGEAVSMAHVLRAARGECGRLDKPWNEAETRDWV